MKGDKPEYKQLPAHRYPYEVRWYYHHEPTKTSHEGNYKYFADLLHALQFASCLKTKHPDYMFAAISNTLYVE